MAAKVGVPVTTLDDKDCSTTPELPVVKSLLRLLDEPLWRGGTPAEGAFGNEVALESTFEAWETPLYASEELKGGLEILTGLLTALPEVV